MYPQAFIDYLIYFHADRDYFECHEVLEEYWKEQDQKDKVWVGFIQLAVALYHQRRGNFNGAGKMMKGAIRILEQEQAQVSGLGVEAPTLIDDLRRRLLDIDLHQPYQSIELPLKEDLKQRCLDICQLQGKVWNNPSNLDDAFLLHKHTRRDRQDVIEERLRNLNERQKKY
ncbi:DUF309 domain-containing protein [Caldalkalibacillus salinus]|uniref:DUF309 domain-containing protein n=1 Tax=Caldalkalibacillus salinus TaxID=2803787 RepID=UPI0019215BB2|nr:DUF309 domain-containing protein [Caldalkalibacillus salinus]